MARFSIKSSSVKSVVTKEENLKRELSNIQNSVTSISQNLSFQISSQRLIRSRLQNLAGDISDCKKSMGAMADALEDIIQKYERYEQNIYRNAGGKGSIIDDPIWGPGIGVSPMRGGAVGLEINIPPRTHTNGNTVNRKIKDTISHMETSSSETGTVSATEKEKKDSLWKGLFSNVVFPQAGLPGAVAKLVLDFDAGKVQPWADFITGTGQGYMKKVLENVSKKANEVTTDGVTAQWAQKQFGEVESGLKSVKENIVEGIGKVKKVAEDGVDANWIKTQAKTVKEGVKKTVQEGWKKTKNAWDDSVKAVSKTAKEAMDDGLEAAWNGAKGRAADGFKKGVDNQVSGVGLGLNFLVSGIVSAAGNYDEYQSKKGTDQEITVERAVKEFVMETAIDVGKGILVAGAVTAGFAAVGITAAPALAVAAVSAGVIWGADVLCEKITGKPVNELISDAILDTQEKVQDLKKKATKAVGKAAKAAGEKISSAWNSFTSGFSFG